MRARTLRAGLKPASFKPVLSVMPPPPRKSGYASRVGFNAISERAAEYVVPRCDPHHKRAQVGGPMVQERRRLD